MGERPTRLARSGDRSPLRGEPWPAEEPRATQLRRADVYTRALVDGRERPPRMLERARDRLRRLALSPGEREELELERQLLGRGELTRLHVVTLASPKGGVGKTTLAFVLGNLLASHLHLRVLALDASADSGTLAALVPDRLRSALSVADLLCDVDEIRSSAELQVYVSRLPTGLHVLGGAHNGDDMGGATAGDLAALLSFAARSYELIVLDLGAGMSGELADFALERADQAVIVTTPDWVTAQSVSAALGRVRRERATLVLNKLSERSDNQQRVIEAHFRGQEIGQRVAIPDDARLWLMLDSGTYSLAALGDETRIAVKRLGLAATRGLR